MCGPGQSQQQLANSQATLAQSLQQSFNSRFAGQDAVLGKLNSALTPILAAGPNQPGFNPAEASALNSQALDTTAANYDSAARAASGQLAGRGGDSGLQSGVDSQIKATIASQAAKQLSGEQLGITQANYETGRQNYNTALAGTQALSGDYAPNDYAKSAGTALDNAFVSANSIDQQNAQMWKTLAGVGKAGLNYIAPGAGATIQKGLQGLLGITGTSWAGGAGGGGGGGNSGPSGGSDGSVTLGDYQAYG